MKVLVVGAGAVGLTFASALSRSAAVTFAVRPARLTAMGCAPAPSVASRATGWRGIPVSADVVSVDSPGGPYDVVWLAVDSTALGEALLTGLRAALSPDGTVVCVQPGAGDWALVQRTFTGHRMVRGRIGFQAWVTPTPGLPGTGAGAAWYALPLSASVFGGDAGASAWVAETLRAGGLAARALRGGSIPSTESASAVLVPLVAGLELSEWRLGALANGSYVGVLRGLARTRLQELGVPLSRCIAAAVFNRLTLQAMALGSGALAINMERFLEVHFSKVGAQTLRQLESWEGTDMAAQARELMEVLASLRS